MLQIIGCVLVCIFILSFFIHPVNAVAPDSNFTHLSAQNITDNSISWYYFDDDVLTKASIDAEYIQNFDTNSTIYTANDLNPSSLHTFCVYSVDDNNCMSTTTLPKSADNIQSFVGFLLQYIWWILGVVILVFAVGYKSSMLGFISAILTLIGLVKGITDKSFIIFMLYLVTFICAYVITESLKEG